MILVILCANTHTHNTHMLQIHDIMNYETRINFSSAVYVSY